PRSIRVRHRALGAAAAAAAAAAAISTCVSGRRRRVPRMPVGVTRHMNDQDYDPRDNRSCNQEGRYPPRENEHRQVAAKATAIRVTEAQMHWLALRHMRLLIACEGGSVKGLTRQ